MAWSLKKICSEIGLSKPLTPGQSMVCSLAARIGNNTFMGLKAEVDFLADGHIVELVFSRWIAKPETGQIEPPGQKPGEKVAQSEAELAMMPLMYIQLTQNHQGTFEFNKAAIGQNDLNYSPSNQKMALDIFYSAAKGVHDRELVDLDLLFFNGVLGDLEIPAVKPTLSWRPILPPDCDEMGPEEREERKPIGFQTTPTSRSMPSTTGSRIRARKRPIRKPKIDYRPKIPGRS